MKKILPLFLIAFIACDDAQNTDAQKQSIINYLQEDSKGVKTDLKIEVSELEVSDITVADSIAILNDKFEKTKETKIRNAEESVNYSEKSIAKITKKIDANNSSTLNQKMDKVVDKL